MKTQVRMIVASVIVIALALTAVSGITYSWFSDTEQSDITITTGKIDLDAKYSDVKVKSYGDTSAKDVTLNDTTGTTTTLAGNVKATTSETSTDSATGSQLAITFNGAAPGDEITFNMAVTIVNTIYVTYKQSIIMDSDAPFTVTGFENKTLKGIAVGNGLNGTSYYMLGTSTAGAQVTIKFNESADVDSYGDKQYTIILAVQAIQMNVEPAEIAATKTISLGTASAETVLTVESAENTANITVTLPTTTKASSGTASSVSVTAKALTAAEVKQDSTMSAVTSGGSVLAGVEISKSVEIVPGMDTSSGSEVQNYFKITMNVGTLSDAVVNALKVYHSNTEVAKSGSQASGDEYYTYADGVVTIYALSFSPFVVIDGSEAIIGTGKYATLSEAITAVNNGTSSGNEITLLADASYSGDLTVSKDATLNLNGHSVTLTNDASFIYYADFNVIGTKADSKVTGSGGCIFYSETTDSALTIDGGDYKANAPIVYSSGPITQVGTGYTTGDGGSVVITSGNFEAKKGDVIYSVNGTVTIDGGKFYNSTVADSVVYSCGSDIIINGGEFTGGKYPIDIQSLNKAGSLTINDGKFNATLTGEESGGYVTFISIGADSEATIGVNGGTYNLTATGAGTGYLFYYGTAAKLSVVGGTYTVTDNSEGKASFVVAWIASGQSSEFISGGTFNIDPSSFVADGYEATKNTETGVWTVVAKA